jgi:CspA family cold shock protein
LRWRWSILEGIVKRWLSRRGYGFIEVDNEEDVFVHHSALNGVFALREGQRVMFETESSPRGLRAKNVQVIE